jgi:hypothetical protein
MKVNSSENQTKNILLFFNENKSPHLSKENKTKTRTDAKHGFLALNPNNYQEFWKNNESRTKPKTLNYPKLNFDMPQNDNLPFNKEQSDFNSLFHKLSNGEFPDYNNGSNPGKKNQNLNIIFFSPNIIVNNDNEQENNSCPMVNKTERNIYLQNNYLDEMNQMKCFTENKSENDKILQKKKNLFDSQYNLIEDNVGNDEISEMLKRFAKIDLNKSVRQNIDAKNKNENIYTHTGDSVNYYSNNESTKVMENPYLKDLYK